ncbi:uncharacterized protein LOC126283940 isoform X3 [Schistocerca gregaria]|uniref:uncharacterized protein LOC126283940 isoform X3 n=1 Tax=Schistocerca gregaria TaxID=7010 RepID=UPI00211E085A|nr:uncharacterized protein LOC126283940 isoform X3 [Schistocerca gregaria]
MIYRDSSSAVMESFSYFDNGRRKVMTYEEFVSLECPSGSEDEFDFDDSDEDPTINVNDLESADSDSEPEAAVVNTHNSNNYCLKDDENAAVADAQVPQVFAHVQNVADKNCFLVFHSV